MDGALSGFRGIEEPEVGRQIAAINIMALNARKDQAVLASGSVGDVSAVGRGREELVGECELFSLILDSMVEGMIVACREGRIILFNRGAKTLTGWAEDEALGKPLAEVYRRLDEATGGPCPDVVEEVLSTARSFTGARSSILIDRKGDRRSISESCTLLRNRQGDVIGVVIVFRDISSRLRMEQEALKTEKLQALGVLAGGIGHDFNNLLTAVLGNISLAKLHADPHSRIINHLAAAEKASLRTRDLTQQLLTFARGGAPIKELTEIGELIRNAASFVLQDSGVELDMALHRELLPVQLDQGQVSQVLNSLLANAAQAMAWNGTVKVRAENINLHGQEDLPLASGPYVRITVTDHGKGIPEEHLPYIFDPYFTTSQKGNGLGLASSYSIIKRHDGYLGVESGLEEGTTFTIYLPASRRQSAMEPSERGPGREREGRILVMDDEPMIREISGELLGYLGFEVDSAASGEEAIRKYEEALRQSLPYRLVIMDLTVPGGMGGREAVRRILDLDPAARVVVSSSFARDAVMIDYERYGFGGALSKPYNLKELVRTINRLLGESEPY